MTRVTELEAGKLEKRIVGAWHTREDARRGKTGLLIAYYTPHGTAHAGDFRKHWRIPEGVFSYQTIERRKMSALPKPAEPREFRLACLNGSLLKAPIYEEHYRGKNWLAVIDVDGTSPGGLSRRFLPYGKGEVFYLVEQLSLFDAVEFGADYQTSVGKNKPKRFYGVVIAITQAEIVLREYGSGADACIAAREARTSPADKLRALEESRAAHLAHAAKIDEEIAALKGA